jgi:hypothetical protein
MVKSLKVLAINCLICAILMSVTWTLSGITIGVACTYIPTVADLFKLSPEDRHILNDGDLIGFALDGFNILLMMIFPYALVITLSLEGRIAYSQTLAKSQQGRDFIDRIKILDESFGKTLRELFGDRT